MFVIPTKVGFTHRVVAMLVACAVILWSLGVYSTAQAANLTSISDTLNDSAPAVVSDHTIQFVATNGVANGGTITIDFSDGPFTFGSVNFTDIDVATTSDYTLAADCTGSEQISAATSTNVLTLTFCAGDGGSLAVGATTTVEIGLNATAGVAGDAQMTNPAVGSYEIVITTPSDTGRTRVAIIDNVLVTATVDTTFDFVILGLATSTAINGTSTTGSTTATAIPFGTLVAGDIYTLGQQLEVTTNARNGFVVTVQQDGNLQSTTGADIDGFIDGAYTDTPTTWSSPTNDILDENTWGHWGLTSDDSDLNAGEFTGGGGDKWVAASTTPRQVFSNPDSADGVTQDVGVVKVGYQIEITGLQEAADDYQAILTYIATPTF